MWKWVLSLTAGSAVSYVLATHLPHRGMPGVVICSGAGTLTYLGLLYLLTRNDTDEE